VSGDGVEYSDEEKSSAYFHYLDQLSIRAGYESRAVVSVSDAHSCRSRQLVTFRVEQPGESLNSSLILILNRESGRRITNSMLVTMGSGVRVCPRP
jgi:hypothetical protein